MNFHTTKHAVTLIDSTCESIWDYLAEDLPARRPSTTLSQSVNEPQEWEHGDRGGPGENHVDASDHKEADGEKPAGTDLVWQHAADEFTDGVGHRLAASDQAWRHKEGYWLFTERWECEASKMSAECIFRIFLNDIN